MAELIWVVCEQRDGDPLPSVLELVSTARSFAPIVEGFSWGAGAARTADVLGAHGLRRLLDLGDLGDSLPGPRRSFCRRRRCRRPTVHCRPPYSSPPHTTAAT